MNNSDGFSLVEMLVAVFIFAILSSAGVAIVSYGIDAKAATAQTTGRLRDIQLARALLKDDLAQPVLRPTRDAYGGRSSISFEGGNDRRGEGVVLSFVRGGWDNPGDVQVRSTLQFVQYILDGDTLYRVSRRHLDPTITTPVERRVLLTGVSDLHVGFFTAEQWIERYEVSPLGQKALPEAIVLEMTVEGFGPLRQLFLVRG